MKVIIFSRVSCNIQDYTRQTQELREYAERMRYEVLDVFEEKISGSRKNEERPVLSKMIQYIKKNEVDKVLSWEISRIGRNTIEVLETINILNENQISLFIKNYNIETLDENGQVNPMSQFMLQILTSVSMMELSSIRQRMKSGYDHFRQKNNGKVGRKKGFVKKTDTLLHEHKDVVKLLKQGYSVRKTMKLTDKSSGTVQKMKKILSES
jgi:DNA invertase Pin-like site-specific DNA recombinase